jgi:hypothetical protein
MTSPAAGWYADPASPDYVRWWDGNAWTEHVQLHPDRAAAVSVSPVETTAGSVTTLTATSRQASSVVETVEAVESSLGAAGSPGDLLVGSADDSGLTARLDATPRSTLVSGVALVVGVIALFLPWMSSDFGWANSFDADLPWMWTGGDFASARTGTLGHGLIFALLFAVALLAVIGRLPNRRLSLMAIGGLVVVLAAADYLSFSGSVGTVAGLSVGFGLYTMVLAGLGLLGAGALVGQE